MNLITVNAFAPSVDAFLLPVTFHILTTNMTDNNAFLCPVYIAVYDLNTMLGSVCSYAL